MTRRRKNRKSTMFGWKYQFLLPWSLVEKTFSRHFVNFSRSKEFSNNMLYLIVNKDNFLDLHGFLKSSIRRILEIDFLPSDISVRLGLSISMTCLYVGLLENRVWKLCTSSLLILRISIFSFDINTICHLCQLSFNNVLKKLYFL